ncbi:mitochondrial substrate carrier family C [Olea europaea subsp. europaea]|uniref:Mitochondrial substrate carrier family C n=1 Tax=Olea europaea subsp. europaea TaxID=158383 RepID=A0A8S0RG16_OLEEU|nr:mitochondrial substrate carrier family C [Olea europaea subsp. europaea]
MVVLGNDPIESFLNSLQVAKSAFSPIESNVRKVAKDLEHYIPGVSKNGTLLGNTFNADIEPVTAQLNVKNKSGNSSGQCVLVNCDEKGKGGLAIGEPIKIFVGIFSEKLGSSIDNDSKNNSIIADVNMKKKRLKERYGNANDGKVEKVSCTNCLQFAVAWSSLINGFVQGFPSPFKDGKKRHLKTRNGVGVGVGVCSDDLCVKDRVVGELGQKESKCKEGKELPFECFIGFVFDQLSRNLLKFDVSSQESECKSCTASSTPTGTNQFDHLRALANILEGKRAYVNRFLGNLMFARVGGMPSSIVGLTPSVNEVSDDGVRTGVTQDENGGNSPQRLSHGLLSIPLSNVERLRSTLSTVSLTELIELLPQLGRPSKDDHPDKKKLFSVQDFFRYTEAEGKRFFQELDRDGDGEVTLEDLEVAMRKRKLPKRYAHEFMHRTRSHLFSKSFGWKQFLSLMEQKEPTILRAYTSLCLSKSGTLQKSEILASLKNAGLPANEDNAIAMMRFLNADTEESISYGHFRNFMLLLPSDRLQDDPRSIWFEAATVVVVAPPVQIPAGSVLKSALAGGLSCALSTALMHPVDTIKTRVQASTLTFPEILSKLPQLGVRGVYRGSIPAILGQFSSHGLRTGIFEASRLVLINVAPTLPEIQVQSVASFCSTFLGTAVRIPCEVLKQRLQAGLFDNVGEAIIGTWQQDGLRGFFRGTGATLFREVPFYVAGMGLYAESKKAAQQLLGRELEAWETIAVGALSGGLTAVLTTPFDVIKTRMMTAPQGRPMTLSLVALSILRHEGPLGLFKGAVPRFFWIAPLGAMNFAGYELARKAMDKTEETGEPLVQK